MIAQKKRMSIADIKHELPQLSNAERIDLMEAIWDSLENKDQERVMHFGSLWPNANGV